MIYDDGTQLIDMPSGAQYAFDAGGIEMSNVSALGEYSVNSEYSQDVAEAQKLSQFYPDQSAPWFAQMAMLGVTRALDSHFGRKAPNVSMQPATYAGQNGKTYATGKNSQTVSNDNLLLMVLAGAALFAFS